MAGDMSDHRLVQIAEITGSICSFPDLTRTLPFVIEGVAKTFDADRGVIVINRGTGAPELVAEWRCSGEAFSPEDRAYSRTAVDHVLRTNEPLVTSNALSDARLSGSQSIPGLQIVSIICVPMRIGARRVGALYLDSRSPDWKVDSEVVAFLRVVADLLAAALELVRSRERLSEAARLSGTFLVTLGVPYVLHQILSAAIKLTWAEQGFLILVENGVKSISVAMNRLGQPLSRDEEKLLSWTLVNQVMASGRPLLSSNVGDDAEFAFVRSVWQRLKSVLCIPIRLQEATIGVLYLENSVQIGVFEEEDLACASLLADSAALAIANARLHARQRRMVRALANAVEFRDALTKEHVERVASWARAVGQVLGLAPDSLAELEESAVLHDIGKIGIRDSVLLKPGPLDSQERKAMEEHPSIGVQIVDPVELPRPVRDGILTHQERWDGKGYPNGLKGEEIPLFGRILAVVDSFDAMVSDRPYRKRMTMEEAIEEIRRGSGKQFDPKVVEAFLGVVEKGGPDVLPTG